MTLTTLAQQSRPGRAAVTVQESRRRTWVDRSSTLRTSPHPGWHPNVQPTHRFPTRTTSTTNPVRRLPDAREAAVPPHEVLWDRSEVSRSATAAARAPT